VVVTGGGGGRGADAGGGDGGWGERVVMVKEHQNFLHHKQSATHAPYYERISWGSSIGEHATR
jgi:hypothetical protein